MAIFNNCIPVPTMLVSVSCRRRATPGLVGNTGGAACEIVESSLFTTNDGFSIGLCFFG